MLPRDTKEAHRAATPLELFFDLVFVIAIAAAAALTLLAGCGGSDADTGTDTDREWKMLRFRSVVTADGVRLNVVEEFAGNLDYPQP